MADTNFDFADPVIGINGRVGAQVGEAGNVYTVIGWAYDTYTDDDDLLLGMGYKHNVGNNLLVSLQYQRYIDSEVNRTTLGLGYRF